MTHSKMVKNKKPPVYLVMTHPRCGSSYLCHLLSKHPDVFDYHESLMLNHSFGYPGTKEIVKTHFKGFNDYSTSHNKISKIPVDHLFNDTFWPDGKYVVGCKMFWELRHHGSKKDSIETSYYWMRNFIYIVDNYKDRLKIIYLNRSHSLRQYLSLKYALKHDNWNFLSTMNKEDKIKFDKKDFLNFLQSPLCSGHQKKFMVSTLKGLSSITIDYTDILGKDKAQKTVDKICNFLELRPRKINFNKTKFKKQHGNDLFNLVSNPEVMKVFLQSDKKYKKFITDEH